MSVRRVVFWLGMATVAAVGSAAVARRPVPEGLVDWRLTGRTARRLAGEPQAWQPDPGLTAHYDAIVRRSFEAVSSYTGMPLELGVGRGAGAGSGGLD